MSRTAALVWLATTSALWPAARLSAEEAPNAQGEVLVFTAAEATQLDGSQHMDDSLEGELSVDLLGSWTSGRFRVLGELFLTTEEQELERLQAGWEIVPETLLWIGRFHTPASEWNTRNHHGHYLQTSITRPSIEEWEDHGGVLPQHVEGLLLESRLDLPASRGLMLSLSGGLGPVLSDGELEPFDILDPPSGPTGGSYALQAKYLPDYAGSDGFGVSLSHSDIMLHDRNGPHGADRADVSVAGVFFDFEGGPWRANGTCYWVRTSFDGPVSEPDDTFVSGYMQVQRRLGQNVTALARLEASNGAERSAYVALFEDFVEQRSVLDLRWDFAEHHALTFEWADTDSLHDRYREYRLQWSASLR